MRGSDRGGEEPQLDLGSGPGRRRKGAACACLGPLPAQSEGPADRTADPMAQGRDLGANLEQKGISPHCPYPTALGRKQAQTLVTSPFQTTSGCWSGPGRRRDGAVGLLLCPKPSLSVEPVFETADPKTHGRDLGAKQIQKSECWQCLCNCP